VSNSQDHPPHLPRPLADQAAYKRLYEFNNGVDDILMAEPNWREIRIPFGSPAAAVYRLLPSAPNFEYGGYLTRTRIRYLVCEAKAAYRGQFDIGAAEPQPDDANWTGAEIRACCRLASLLEAPLQQAARNVVPVAVTAAEQVERLRNWASGRCLSAAVPGIYARSEPASAKPGRRVTRPSDN
jgi:hypothetical protein